MNWHRFITLSLWSVGFLIVWLMAFTALMMGDCIPEPATQAACIAFKDAVPMWAMLGGPAIYALLTWAFLIRRWRKQG